MTPINFILDAVGFSPIPQPVLSRDSPLRECFPSLWGWSMVAAGTRRMAAVVEYDGREVDPSEVQP